MMKKIILIVFVFAVFSAQAQRQIRGDSLSMRNGGYFGGNVKADKIYIKSFPTSTNPHRNIKVDNNGLLYLDTLDYDQTPTISSYIDKSRTCNSSRDDKDAFVTAFAATDKLIIDDGCYYINSTLTIPAGKTLIFEPGGMIAGTGTITGNETEIQAGLSQIFDTTLTIDQSGSWKCKEVYTEWFGANNISTSADAYMVFYKAFNMALSTDNRSVKFGIKRNYTLNRTVITQEPISIDFNNSVITLDTNAAAFAIGKDDIDITTGDTITMSSDLLYGNVIIKLTDSLKSVEIGDIINVMMDSVWFDRDAVPAGRDYGWGEYGEVQYITSDKKTVYLKKPLSLFYLTSKSARVVKANLTSNICIRNVAIVSTKDPLSDNNTVGLKIGRVMHSNFENLTFINTLYKGLFVRWGYDVDVNEINSSGERKTGLGYGICLSNMNDVKVHNCDLTSSRHTITTDAAYQTHVLSNNIHIYNCNLSSTMDVAINNNLPCVYFHEDMIEGIISNCNLIGTVNTFDKTYTAWSSSTTYNTLDNVYYNNDYWTARTTNTNSEPSYTNGDWNNKYYASSGFSESSQTKAIIIDNVFTGFYRGIGVSGDIIAKGNIFKNCNVGIGLYSDSRDKKTKHNFEISNNTFEDMYECIEINPSDNNNNITINNNIIHNSYTGIYAKLDDNKTDITITNNRSYDNGYSFVYLYSVSDSYTKLHVQNNIVSGDKNFVYLYKYSSSNDTLNNLFVADNVFIPNITGGDFVYINTPADTIIAINNYEKSRMFFYLGKATNYVFSRNNITDNSSRYLGVYDTIVTLYTINNHFIDGDAINYPSKIGEIHYAEQIEYSLYNTTTTTPSSPTSGQIYFDGTYFLGRSGSQWDTLNSNH